MRIVMSAGLGLDKFKSQTLLVLGTKCEVLWINYSVQGMTSGGT